MNIQVARIGEFRDPIAHRCCQRPSAGAWIEQAKSFPSWQRKHACHELAHFGRREVLALLLSGVERTLPLVSALDFQGACKQRTGLGNRVCCESVHTSEYLLFQL